MADVRHGISIPPFGPFSDPSTLLDAAVAAEEHGWDGVFLWDHLLREPDEATLLADPWVMLSAMAVRTSRIRIGPLVTPVTRRRPFKLAREVATLDLLSEGRLTLGLGLGVDRGGELTRTGEVVDPVVQAQRLDEGVQILDGLLRGEHVTHRGEHFLIDGITLSPRGVQQPRVPFWLAARGETLKPVRRAARYEGIALLAVSPDRFSEIVGVIEGERGSLDGFDIVAMCGPDDPVAEYVARGATWVMHEVRPQQSHAEVVRIITSL